MLACVCAAKTLHGNACAALGRSKKLQVCTTQQVRGSIETEANNGQTLLTAHTLDGQLHEIGEQFMKVMNTGVALTDLISTTPKIPEDKPAPPKVPAAQFEEEPSMPWGFCGTPVLPATLAGVSNPDEAPAPSPTPKAAGTQPKRRSAPVAASRQPPAPGPELNKAKGVAKGRPKRGMAGTCEKFVTGFQEPSQDSSFSQARRPRSRCST